MLYRLVIYLLKCIIRQLTKIIQLINIKCQYFFLFLFFLFNYYDLCILKSNNQCTPLKLFKLPYISVIWF